MPAMAPFPEIGQTVARGRNWQRVEVDSQGWQQLAIVAAEGGARLGGLWAEKESVHLALVDGESGRMLVGTHACAEGRFPSVAALHAPAIRPERAIADLYGLLADGAPDTRPWLDHGRWDVRHPLGDATAASGAAAAYVFRGAEGPPMHQIPVGPVHAGIIEPGHFRFTASGECVVRLEERLGYVHKGIDGLLVGANLEQAAPIAARVSGDSTVAYAVAFAQAVEEALGIEVPEPAVLTRGIAAELERIANHLGDFGAISNDAAFSMLHAHCGVLRERTLRAAAGAFGHRLMMDLVVPGGVRRLPDRAGQGAIRELIALIARDLPPLAGLYDASASLQDRTVATGRLDAALARAWSAGGYVGRASGLSFDARKTPGYAPYDRLEFSVALRTTGDVDARVRVRIAEIETSLALVDQMLDALEESEGEATAGDLANLSTVEGGEGMALVEGFRGDVLAHVRIGPDRRIAACHLRDPSVFQWPLLEAAIEGNIVADFPLVNKSFNCSYSGHDM
ncbi:MAG: NADH-quinone oxidoreductase subunit C [Hyphomicrobiaceae bacterium]